MQSFVGSCVRYLSYKAKEMSFRRMEEEHVDMRRLYGWLGLDLVEVMVAKRTMSYLGHLGRYRDDRWEVQMLGAELGAWKGTAGPGARRLTLRQWYWSWIHRVMSKSDVAQEECHGQWRPFACRACAAGHAENPSSGGEWIRAQSKVVLE
eukprot:11296813-Heterocapsa_arctica.AAC.1